MSNLIYRYGKFCATHPWEIIVVFMVSVCWILKTQLNGDVLRDSQPDNCAKLNPSSMSIDQVSSIDSYCVHEIPDSVVHVCRLVLICILSGGIAYTYYQFRSLCKRGSTHLLRIAQIFTVFSIGICCLGAVKFVGGNLSEIPEYFPFILILTNLSEASLLAQFGLSSSSQEEVRENIARGIAILGPSLTLDTMLKTLLIGLGTLLGIRPIEKLCYFGSFSPIIYYVIFMALFPACLSLGLELSFQSKEGRPSWQLSSLTEVLQKDSNPAKKTVKLIMLMGLIMVYMVSFETIFRKKLWQWTMIVFICICFFVGKYIFFNGDDALADFYLESEKLNETVEEEKEEQIVSQERKQTSLSKHLEQQKQQQNDKLSRHSLKEALKNIEIRVTSEQTILEDKDSNEVASEISEDSDRQRSLTPTNITVQQDSDTESVIVENKKKRPKRINNGGEKSGSPSFFLGDDSLSDSCEDLDSLSDSEPGAEGIAAQEKTKPRPVAELAALLKTENGLKGMTDTEVISLVDAKMIAQYKLEVLLDDPERGVRIRRMMLARDSKCTSIISDLPYANYDYKYVLGACCENVIGYMPIPLGVAGPLLLDDRKYHIPMATTEGCLIASTNRGCRALMMAGGVRSAIVGDGMTRAPCVKFPNAMRAAAAMRWIQQEDNFAIIKETFDSTSRFARLDRVLTRIAGPYVYFRFSATTGDAMGMNMVSKGAELAITKLKEYFPDMEMNVLSGNFCSDKKPSAVNWIEGRGKSVVCEAEIPAKIVDEVLKTSVQSLVHVNICKNLVGSAVSGSIGGFNAHAANIVAAMYIATGQDPAQNIGSSNCMTLIESITDNKGEENLYISCTMPSLELGTIGGGTILPPQASCLDLLGVRGSCFEEPGRNSKEFARIVCGTVLAAELSLLSALAAGHLVKSHMKHNRSTVSINASPLNSIASHTGLRASSQQFLAQCQPQ